MIPVKSARWAVALRHLLPQGLQAHLQCRRHTTPPLCTTLALPRLHTAFVMIAGQL